MKTNKNSTNDCACCYTANNAMYSVQERQTFL